MGNGALICQSNNATANELDDRKSMHNIWVRIVTKLGSNKVGSEIFRRILAQGTSIPLLFNLQDAAPSEYSKRSEFIIHASRIFDTLNRYFDYWANGHDRKLKREAALLGKKHFTNLAEKRNNKGFNPSLWLLMPTIMGDVLGPHLEKEHPNLKRQMHLFIDLVVNTMRDSYTEHAQSRGYVV